jgi:glycosyltransferase involved in cell wall biosynthesis
MRILQISSARSIGGGERHVIDLSNELAKRGHAVFVATVPDSPLPVRLSELPVDHLIEVPLRNAVDISSSVRLARFASEKRIELINAHFAKDYTVSAAAARIARVPLVLTRHVLFPMNRLHRLLLRDVRYVIAPSNAVAESLRNQHIFPSQKIVTIRYGLDVEKFQIRDRDDSNAIVIGSIGNLDRVKGFDILIRAAAIVSKEIPDVKFRIVGEDRSRDGHNKKELAALIEKLGLNSTVELAGWSDDVADALGEFDIFVSSSRSESFGFVIAEAMLSGVPVIATETEGAKEIISDRSFGALVPVESAEALAAAILDFTRDPSLLDRLVRSSRNHVRTNFSLERMVDETEELYERCI